MHQIAKFEKVSLEEFSKFFDGATMINGKIVTDELVREMYDTIKLPTRATKGSAGYDFVTPFKFDLIPAQGITIPTGIRCKMENGWGLFLLPKSGLGFKYRCQLDNTLGLVDSDYFYSDNEGHIMAKITNDSKVSPFHSNKLEVEAGKAFMQGVFLPFGITVDDNAKASRNGGFGSTDS